MRDSDGLGGRGGMEASIVLRLAGSIFLAERREFIWSARPYYVLATGWALIPLHWYREVRHLSFESIDNGMLYW